jgi:hypothetical protein
MTTHRPCPLITFLSTKDACPKIYSEIAIAFHANGGKNIMTLARQVLNAGGRRMPLYVEKEIHSEIRSRHLMRVKVLV